MTVNARSRLRDSTSLQSNTSRKEVMRSENYACKSSSSRWLRIKMKVLWIRDKCQVREMCPRLIWTSLRSSGWHSMINQPTWRWCPTIAIHKTCLNTMVNLLHSALLSNAMALRSHSSDMCSKRAASVIWQETVPTGMLKSHRHYLSVAKIKSSTTMMRTSLRSTMLSRLMLKLAV